MTKNPTRETAKPAKTKKDATKRKPRSTRKAKKTRSTKPPKVRYAATVDELFPDDLFPILRGLGDIGYFADGDDDVIGQLIWEFVPEEARLPNDYGQFGWALLTALNALVRTDDDRQRLMEAIGDLEARAYGDDEEGEEDPEHGLVTIQVCPHVLQALAELGHHFHQAG